MSEEAYFWADHRLVYLVAAAAVALLLVTVWLFRRRSKEGRQAAVVCLTLSLGLHLSLIVLVPMLDPPPGGASGTNSESDDAPGIETVEFGTFDPDLLVADAAGMSEQPTVAPLPVASLTESVQSEPPPIFEQPAVDADLNTAATENEPDSSQALDQQLAVDQSTPVDEVAAFDEQVLGDWDEGLDSLFSDSMAEIDSSLSELLDAAFMASSSTDATPVQPTESPTIIQPAVSSDQPVVTQPVSAVSAVAASALVPAAVENDFANRVGDAKQQALLQTGGNEQTEAAVQAALRFLSNSQRPDGSWGSRASGGGIERRPLGITRGGAGSRAETAITGLALLTLMGAGHTHQGGDYADNVYRGLAYLIRAQQPSGSLAGDATINAATYCHGIAALAMCEAAAITQDANAIACSRRAIAYTQRMQHPTTGGWRYAAGDPGDLSQLGWQAMVLDSGHRAGIEIDTRSVQGVQRFLRRVRMGTSGGIATYRPGEAPSQTMTAEALATRLLIGEQVDPAEIAEAERYLLERLPGSGQDNYYYWYYATLAMHQLQDDAWRQWNTSLQQRLLATQRSDGSWASGTVWGGYGGTVYTTSMGALCLETYYRHTIRESKTRIADRPGMRR